MLLAVVVIASGCHKETNSEVKVTTYTPQDITSITAVCGGDVIVAQGLSLTELGVCWGTSKNPTVDQEVWNYSSTDHWDEPFVEKIGGLEPNTKYHVRAYALRGLEYYYGEDKSFTTESFPNPGGDEGNGSIGGHAYVDLGLPSGTLWATCNVGANTPEGYGDYFAWGETTTKDNYDWTTYKHANGTGYYDRGLIKYCDDGDYGYNGFTDNLTTLEAVDDAATANWGNGWKIPTLDQWWELLQNTENSLTMKNGVYGRVFIATNGNRLFLPAAGLRSGTDPAYIDYGYHACGYYWSSSLKEYYPIKAWYLELEYESANMDGYGGNRYDDGYTVRPVCSPQK